jgi:hypothetical protein
VLLSADADCGFQRNGSPAPASPQEGVEEEAMALPIDGLSRRNAVRVILLIAVSPSVASSAAEDVPLAIKGYDPVAGLSAKENSICSADRSDQVCSKRTSPATLRRPRKTSGSFESSNDQSSRDVFTDGPEPGEKR